MLSNYSCYRIIHVIELFIQRNHDSVRLTKKKKEQNLEMGHSQSTSTQKPTLFGAEAVSRLSEVEIKAIQQSFHDLALRIAPSTTVDKETFLQFFPLPGLMGQQFFSLLDQDSSGFIDLEQFMCGIAVLVKGDGREKLEFLFRLHDTTDNGVVSKRELTAMMHALVSGVCQSHWKALRMNTLIKAGDKLSQSPSENADSKSDCIGQNRERIDSEEERNSTDDKESDSAERQEGVSMYEFVHRRINQAVSNLVGSAFSKGIAKETGFLNMEDFISWLENDDPQVVIELSPDIVSHMGSSLYADEIEPDHCVRIAVLSILDELATIVYDRTRLESFAGQSEENTRETALSLGHAQEEPWIYSASPEIQAIFPSDVMMAGVLHKRGKRFRMWKSRYYVLRQGVLCYYPLYLVNPEVEGSLIESNDTKQSRVLEHSDSNTETRDKEKVHNTSKAGKEEKRKEEAKKKEGKAGKEEEKRKEGKIDEKKVSEELIDQGQHKESKRGENRRRRFSLSEKTQPKRGRIPLGTTFLGSAEIRKLEDHENSWWTERWKHRCSVEEERDSSPRVSKAFDSGRYGFEIICGEKRTVLYASSDWAREQWVASLREASQRRELHSVVDISFEERSLLGEGGQGSVYAGTLKENGLPVAVKSILTENLTHTQIQGIRNEIAVLSVMQFHTATLGLIDVFETSKHLYLVTELLRGPELLNLLEDLESKGKSCREDIAATILRPVFDALSTLHKSGAVHNDLKPSNLMFRNPIPTSLPYADTESKEDDIEAWKLSQLTVVDFGFSRFSLLAVRRRRQRNFGSTRGTKKEEEEELDEIVPGGTFKYFAPELFSSDYSALGSPIDIWSMGIVLFRLICGKFPFSGADVDEFIENIKHGRLNVEASSFHRPGSQTTNYWASISEPARNLLLQMLEPNPRKRITAEDVLSHHWMIENAK